jgi:type IV secretion system protein VirB10
MQRPVGVVKFRRSVVVVGIAVVLGVVAYGLMDVGGGDLAKQPADVQATTLTPKPADVFAQLPQSYRDMPAEEPPAPPEPPKQPVLADDKAPTEPPAAKTEPPAPKHEPRPGQQARSTTPASPKQWKAQLHGDGSGGNEARTPPAREEARQEKAIGREIIHRARWAMPAQPLKTIYKSMDMIGRLKRSVNSDIPGIVVCELSIPLFDKFGYGEIILDKKTDVILKQPKERLDYGSRRVAMVLDQIEPPSGEILVAKGFIEDQDGKAGMTGRVNNHWLQLGAAVLINAGLSLGTQSLAGTPGRGQFYADPAQQAARDAAQSFSQDTRSIVNQQLKVPPTIEIDAGTPCLVQLDENIVFDKKAVTVP